MSSYEFTAFLNRINLAEKFTLLDVNYRKNIKSYKMSFMWVAGVPIPILKIVTATLPNCADKTWELLAEWSKIAFYSTKVNNDVLVVKCCM